MAYFTGPNIVQDGLVLALDAGSTRSYPGTGTTWYDLSGNENNFTKDTFSAVRNMKYEPPFRITKILR